MEDLLNRLESLNQEQAIVALFAAILIGSASVIGFAAAIRSLGRDGVIAVALAVAAVLIAYRMIG